MQWILRYHHQIYREFLSDWTENTAWGYIHSTSKSQNKYKSSKSTVYPYKFYDKGWEITTRVVRKVRGQADITVEIAFLINVVCTFVIL